MSPAISSKKRQDFTTHLIDDLDAIDLLLKEGKFETGVNRIGAEQEFCLIDYKLQPAMLAMEMLEKLKDPHFTNELARFNLEVNLDPLEFKGDCLSALENDLIHLLTKANKRAHQLDAKIILTGILPTIRQSDIILENMTPSERYMALNDAIHESRGGDFEFNIRGLDELITRHDTVLFESCNTSFQVHLQESPESIIPQMNLAQAISGPVLAAATNSPMFLGKRLWSETRIALFHQSADPRRPDTSLRTERPRVTFGQDWERGSITDFFKENVTRYKVLMTSEIEENSKQIIKDGGVPKLAALALHNSTIYRWNRPCYGITDGVPHLRIENRYLPAGPTIVDEVANTAFWIGIMKGGADTYNQIHEQLDFDRVKENFLNAAKNGLDAQFKWVGRKLVPAQELIQKELLPLAKAGLTQMKVDPRDIDKYLTIIEERVDSRKTGSHWIFDAYDKLKKSGSRDEALVSITDGIYQRQKIGNPVHQWEEIMLSEGGGWTNRYQFVEQIMARELITVQADDLLTLVKNVMLWSRIHYVPVENNSGNLVGLVSSDILLQRLGTMTEKELATTTVEEIMFKEVLTTTPNTKIVDAFHKMRNNELGCLPVIDEDNKLVGIVTEHDYLKIMGQLIKEIKELEVVRKQEEND
jgi:CBS domain-containing protein